MPEGYGLKPADEGSGLLPWEHVESRLAAARNYWIGTTRSDGRPHAIPVWGLWLDDAIWFSTDPKSLKGRNLARRPEVVVHLESGDDVVIVEGRADRISEPAPLARFADVYEQKYNLRMDPTNPDFGIYRVEPLVVLAWLESDFPGIATRWRLG
jgi:PPOX class probable F420-dependent enzyme